MESGSNYSVKDFHLKSPVEIFGELYVPEKPKAAVLFLHGMFNNSRCLENYARKLAENGYLCCCYDARNHGRSKSDLSIHAMVDDVSTVIGRLEKEYKIKRFGIVGYSMGAIVAALASANEKRIGACVTISLPVSPVKDVVSSKNRILTRVKAGLENLILEEKIDRKYIRIPRELVENIHDNNALVRKFGEVVDYLENIRKEGFREDTPSFDLCTIYCEFSIDLVEEKIYERIKQPFCLFHGSGDWFTPLNRALEMYGLLKCKRECYIYTGNHFIFIDKFGDISERMREFFDNNLK